MQFIEKYDWTAARVKMFTVDPESLYVTNSPKHVAIDRR